MLLVVPLAITIYVERHMLPINAHDLSAVAIADCWHLEWEKSLCVKSVVLTLLNLGSLPSRIIETYNKVVTEELSVKAANDHDLIS